MSVPNAKASVISAPLITTASGRGRKLAMARSARSANWLDSTTRETVSPRGRTCRSLT